MPTSAQHFSNSSRPVLTSTRHFNNSCRPGSPQHGISAIVVAPYPPLHGISAIVFDPCSSQHGISTIVVVPYPQQQGILTIVVNLCKSLHGISIKVFDPCLPLHVHFSNCCRPMLTSARHFSICWHIPGARLFAISVIAMHSCRIVYDISARAVYLCSQNIPCPVSISGPIHNPDQPENLVNS